jgi:hypothetical protein
MCIVKLLLSVWLVQTLLLSLSARADKTTCKTSRVSIANLSELLSWCEKHQVPDGMCNELLEDTEKLSALDFKKKLSHSENDLTAKNKRQLRDLQASNSDWHDIPVNPNMAFLKLNRLTESANGNGFVRKINFGLRAEKHFDSLNASEIKNAYEVVNKMKSSANRFELESFLKAKGLESIGKNSKHCSGTKVMSIRLSHGARMCFQYGEDNAISILCIGAGSTCYRH